MKILKLTIFCFAVLLMVQHGYGYVSYNRSCSGFVEECEPNLLGSTPSMGQRIIEAAGSFIKSNSDFQLLLREIEISGSYDANIAALPGLIHNAASNMRMANATYLQMWQTSEQLDYDPVTRDQLLRFDYSGYQVQNNLNRVIFEKVAGYLKNGDVRATYQQAYIATAEILERLETLKRAIEKNKLPRLDFLWRLNQLYLETALFGQYVAEVFCVLK